MPSENLPQRQIPLCEPFLGGREREYVDDCLATGWVSSVGKYVDRFESEFAARHPGTGAVAVASGTAALHLALLAVGVQPEDEVLVSTLTFIAPANAVRYVGAWPLFVDAEPDFWQMDTAKLEQFLSQECVHREQELFNKKTGRRVAAILPVHILGHPVDMDAIMDVANRHGLKVVEDATESLGAKVRGRLAGTMGHVGCFSFNGNKLMTTGGGGMVLSSDPGICKTVRSLSTQAKDPGNEYIHKVIGYNYRMTNVQAALGCAQLEQLEGFLLKKKAIAARYTHAFADLPGIVTQREASWAESAHWLFTILVEEVSRGDARNLIAALATVGITTRPLWEPMHRSKAHADSPRVSCPVADRLFLEGVSLPSSVGLPSEDQESVIEAIRFWLQQA